MPISPQEIKTTITFDPEVVKFTCVFIDRHLSDDAFIKGNRQKSENGQSNPTYYWQVRLPECASNGKQVTAIDIAEIRRAYLQAGWLQIEEIVVPEDRGDPAYRTLRLVTDMELF